MDLFCFLVGTKITDLSLFDESVLTKARICNNFPKNKYIYIYID